MMTKINLPLKYIAPVPKIDDGYEFYRAFISSQDKCLFLFREYKAENPYAQPLHYKVVVQTEGTQDVIDLGLVDLSSPVIDMLADGRIVMARGESLYDINKLGGLIYDPQTEESVKFRVGEGVASIGIDNQSRIFISYMDEGVLSDGIGCGGVNCFDDKGNLLWSYNDGAAKGEFITDCLAMNITDDGVFVYYYHELSLCRIDSGFSKTFWETGSKEYFDQISVNQDAILFSKQATLSPQIVRNINHQFWYGQRLAHGLSDLTPINVTLENGELLQHGKLVGHKDCIHYFDERGWYRASIDELSA